MYMGRHPQRSRIHKRKQYNPLHSRTCIFHLHKSRIHCILYHIPRNSYYHSSNYSIHLRIANTRHCKRILRLFGCISDRRGKFFHCTDLPVVHLHTHKPTNRPFAAKSDNRHRTFSPRICRLCIRRLSSLRPLHNSYTHRRSKPNLHWVRRPPNRPLAAKADNQSCICPPRTCRLCIRRFSSLRRRHNSYMHRRSMPMMHRPCIPQNHSSAAKAGIPPCIVQRHIVRLCMRHLSTLHSRGN